MRLISESDKKHILSLYSINEKTNPLDSNLGKNGVYKPTTEDLNLFKYTETVPNLKANDRRDWVEKMSIFLLSELELIKYQKSWGSIPCKPCKLSITGTVYGDSNNDKTCVNTHLLAKTWKCPEGYNAYSVMAKEYGTIEWDKMKDQVNSFSSYEDPAAKFISDNKHELLMAASIGALFIPVIGPGLSLGIDLIDAGIYLYEGDKYSAGLSAVFALVPLGFIAKKTGIALTPKIIKPFLLKIGNKTTKPLSEFEKRLLEGLNKNKGLFTKYARLYGRKALVKKILTKKGSLKFILSVSKKFGKLSFFVGKLGLQIGGVYYTYDKLYNIFNTNPKEAKKLEEEYSEEKENIDNQVTNQILQSNISDNELLKLSSTEMSDDEI
jgi:hypothetical protein